MTAGLMRGSARWRLSSVVWPMLMNSEPAIGDQRRRGSTNGLFSSAADEPSRFVGEILDTEAMMAPP